MTRWHTAPMRQALDRVLDYAQAEDLAGYAKFDALNSPLLRLASCGTSFLRLAFTQAMARCALPSSVRKVLLIPKVREPSAVGRFASAYVALHKTEPETGWLDRAAECAQWLKDNATPGYAGCAWGYHFPWQNGWRSYTPKGLPNLVVTRKSAEAFLDLYDATGEAAYLDVARSAADHVLRDLPVLKETDTELCISYVPRKLGLTVVNTNAQAAMLLARVGAATGETELTDTARKLLTYVEGQKTDYHAWYYTDPPRSNSPITHDNYHTANILDGFVAYFDHTHDDRFLSAYRAGLTFFRERLYLDSGAPKWMHDKVYPHDIRGAAGGIATFSRAGLIDPAYMDFAFQVARWAIDAMQDRHGYFYYQQTRRSTKRFTLMYWCNASMAYALALLCCRAAPARRGDERWPGQLPVKERTG